MVGTPASRAVTTSYREEDDQLLRVGRDEGDKLNGFNLNGSGASLKLGTWNVRTLHQAGKLQNCIMEMEDHKVDAMGLAEVRWLESGKIEKEGHHLFYSGGDKHEHGVGVLIHKKHVRAVMGYWPISDRVIVVKMEGRPFNVVLIQVYAPTTQHSDEEIERFYADVEKGLKQVKSTDIVITMGDFNAKVGKGRSGDVVGDHGLGERNERGDRLVQFCQEQEMWIANTHFQKPERKLYTWRSPGDVYRNQIDFLLINKRFKNCVKDVKSYPGADVNSDHNLLIGRVSIKLKKVKKQKGREQYDLNMLKDEESRVTYAVEVKNRYEALAVEEAEQIEEAIDKKWENFKESIRDGTKTLPKTKKKKEEDWMTDKIKDLLRRRKKEEHQSPKYREIEKEIRKECREAKEKWFNERCDEIMELEKNHNSRELHRRVKDLTGKNKKSTDSGCIKDKDGNMLFDKEEVEKRWTEYIRELYDDPNRADPEPIEIGEGPDITVDEVKYALKLMGARKAPGIDGITTEQLRALDEESIVVLTEICNSIYTTGHIPADMKHSVFIKIPKKKKALECGEHRTISLMSHVIKLILRIIIERNAELFEREVSETQSGFKSKIGTREGLFNVRSIIDKVLAVGKKLYICFIDYEKAFDRVYHEQIMRRIERAGMDAKDRRLISNLYYEQTASIQFGDTYSEEFKVKRGVRQGCVLSPKLFNVYTEDIFEDSEELTGIVIGGLNITSLRFADDTLLMAESEEELQRIVDAVREASLERGLRMNVKKTKTMVIRRNINEECKVSIKVEGKELEQVKSYTYLGQQITEDGRSDTEIRKRIEIARQSFINMKSVLTSRKLKIETKKRLIRCYVLSTFLYASETWTIDAQSWKRIEAFEMWCWRRMMRLSYKDHVTNDEVLRRTNSKRSLRDEITKRKLQYFGHVIRREKLQRVLMDGKIEGSRGRGRPRRTWVRDVTEATGKSYVECVRLAQRREKLQSMMVNEKNSPATGR